ncbi:putative transcriptional regulator, Crp/Fnr family [Methylorubrum extorquens DM4]|uniref:Transcriptional regulator, Crp/Fnr family n=1 Tax=Methylorubrum extorquens (strain DSM 6343 / CIP 106787 / DM4) TaxID=661410 RepID=C7CFW7_METED|nr:helix-turn-helix domain-containing protein [Methylorubrum extorquens]CAX23043.1 putative transcriptional regulator, Crp/Fnr family [Methylorubrum extorquens DM4]
MNASDETEVLPEAAGCLCPSRRGPREEALPCDLRSEKETRAFLQQQAGCLVAAPDKVISRGGSAERRCFRVTDGVVRLVRYYADGRRQVTRFAFSGDYFGLSQAERELAAEAVSPATLLEFDLGRLQQLSDCNPYLARQLADALRAGVDQATEHVVLMGWKDPRQRLAAFLRMLHGYLGLGDVVSIPMSRIDIADYIGLTAETVSRAFAELRRRSIVEDIDRQLLRLDVSALGRFVEDGL